MELAFRVGVDALRRRRDVVFRRFAVGFDCFITLSPGSFRIGGVGSATASNTHGARVEAGFAVRLGRRLGLFYGPEKNGEKVLSVSTDR